MQPLVWPPGGDVPIPYPWPEAERNLADLVVANISTGIDYDASGRLNFYVEAEILNQGTAKAGPFVTLEITSGQHRASAGLQPGESTRIRWFRSHCESSGIVMTDVTWKVTESNNRNNDKSWIKIC